MSISFDPLTLVKDYLSKRKEQKELDALVGKFYRVTTNGTATDGFLLKVTPLAKSVSLVLETKNGEVLVPIENVEKLEQVPQKFRLEELIELTKAVDGSRTTHLSWIIGAAKPVREAARKWFDEETGRVRHQIRLLVDLFPHRTYQTLADTLNEIESGFDESIAMLDGVISLVEQKRVTQINEIYHEHRPAKFPGQREEPDVVVAIIGMFAAASQLDSLNKRIDGIVGGITDTVTIAKILDSGS